MAALLAPALQGLTATRRTHAHAKAVCFRPPSPVRLVGAFQKPCSLSDSVGEAQIFKITVDLTQVKTEWT